ncbi:histidine phosphatase family protein [Pseudomonas sp. Pseu.R1]|uniref:lipopolysaccharide core heptose(II)-phosphate phosphatase PmrG n=1 Tax=Pseudomonas sp. Pseu.R1 TaxID=3379818 RepID=UPI003B93E439
MNSNFTHVLDELGTRYHALGTLSRRFLFLAGLLSLIGLAAFVLRPAPLADLAQGQRLHRANFFSLWEKGDLVVLVRHVERCDHSTNPCLAQPDGITVKGRVMADRLGQAFQSLGMQGVNLYNSPLRRTEQTAAFAFNQTTEGQDWLANCRKSMLSNVINHKQDGHNLVLVTHSECIADLEKSLNVPSPSSPDYGSALIVSVDPQTHVAKALGYIDPQDWVKVLAKRP